MEVVKQASFWVFGFEARVLLSLSSTCTFCRDARDYTTSSTTTTTAAMATEGEAELDPLPVKNLTSAANQAAPAQATSESWLHWDILPSEWDILFLSTTVKLLLFPS